MITRVDIKVMTDNLDVKSITVFKHKKLMKLQVRDHQTLTGDDRYSVNIVHIYEKHHLHLVLYRLPTPTVMRSYN